MEMTKYNHHASFSFSFLSFVQTFNRYRYKDSENKATSRLVNISRYSLYFIYYHHSLKTFQVGFSIITKRILYYIRCTPVYSRCTPCTPCTPVVLRVLPVLPVLREYGSTPFPPWSGVISKSI